ncbi:hypothetical protein B0H12DRAFT_1234624 [Mycena haematopus]|nr:hypothetical protein B0H12DRAFT_1234624 [Mycena haematopus]
MSFSDAIAVLVSLFALFIAGASAQKQTAVTLWQFGQGRLLQAQLTLPLEPLGTASDGSATTYLYQALNNALVTTTNTVGITTQTIPKATPRTIVASASGWAESNFGIRCGLVDSTFGECFFGTNTVPANSGVPTPEAILIADPTPTSAPTPQSAARHQKHSPPVGAIVAGVLGGCFLLLLTLSVFLVFRRRRGRQEEYKHTAARSYDLRAQAADGNNSNSGSRQSHAPSAVFAAGPQAELGLGAKRHKRDYSGESLPESRVEPRVASELPTSDLVRILAQRMQNSDQRGTESPPAYPTTPHP